MIFAFFVTLTSIAAVPAVNDGHESSEGAPEAGERAPSPSPETALSPEKQKESDSTETAGSSSELGGAIIPNAPSQADPSKASDHFSEYSVVPSDEPQRVPILVYAPPLNYPPQALAEGIGGTVLLEIDVASNGLSDSTVAALQPYVHSKYFEPRSFELVAAQKICVWIKACFQSMK